MTSIPGAAVAALAAGLDDYRRTTPAEEQAPHGAAERAAEYLASSGWTLNISNQKPGTRHPCPICGSHQLLTAAGLIRRHGSATAVCRGTAAAPPAPTAADTQ